MAASLPEHAMAGTSGPILVTGAAGFIGSHVCEALLHRGDRVVGVDNFDPFYRASLKRENVAQIERVAHQRSASPAWSFEELDICDESAVRAALNRHKPSGMIHLAAKAGVRPSIADPAGYSRANVLGTSVLLEESRRAGLTRFVMASSSSVYGNNAKVPFSETDDVSEPISPYAATKRACELLGYTHSMLTKTPTACLRFFTVYGPRQRPDLAIGLFLQRVGAGERIRMFGDGGTSRDYTFIDDIVAGVIASHDRIDRHGYRVWNLGGNEPVKLSDMIATIERVVGRKADVERLPAQPGDVERTFADLTRSGAELDYKPTTSFEAGVRKQWEWMRARSA